MAGNFCLPAGGGGDGQPIAQYDEFRYQFGRDERIMIIVESDKGDIFTLDFLQKLEAFHKDLEANTPKLEKITSLINARLTRGEGDELIVGDFLEKFPQNDA